MANRIGEVLESSQVQVLADWMKALRVASGKRAGAITDAEQQAQCQEFIGLLRAAVSTGALDDPSSARWQPVREFLAGVSRSRSRQGFSPSETAGFIFSIKEPLIEHLRASYRADDQQSLFGDLWKLSTALDRLGLYTTEVYQAAREEIIRRQTEEMLELSTPVIQLADGILALPIIGTLDSNRTQVVMEVLLQHVVSTRSPIAILDITGVPTVDTVTAQHILKTVAAARLMGAECIISGIRPAIAQTIVHLGVNLGDVITKASLADAFQLALRRLDQAIVKRGEV